MSTFQMVPTARTRPKIPKDIEAEVLFRSAHTCCICRESRKHVQIHHINGRADVNSLDNLAVVCLDCHSLITGPSGLGKSYKLGEVWKYKEDWELRVKQSRERSAERQADYSELSKKEVSDTGTVAEGSKSLGTVKSDRKQRILRYDKLIEALKDDLLLKLDEFLNLKTIPDVIQASEHIEGYLLRYVKSVLGKWSTSLIPDTRYNPDTSEIEIHGQVYEIRLQENILDSSLVEVALVQRQPMIPKPLGESRHFKILGNGRYQQAKIWLPGEIEFNREWISALTNAIFQTGYLWLEERIRSISSNPESALTMNLYSYLRAVIANDELVGNIWLMCCTDGKGVFLLQPYTAFTALRTIGASASTTGQSALRLVAEFMGTDIQDKKLFSTIAARDDISREFDLKEAKFKDDVPIVLRAEICIFEAESIFIYPITKNASGYLVAVLPTKRRETILPILQLHKDELARRFRESRDHLSKMYRVIRDNEWSFDDLALGTASSGFLTNVFGKTGKTE